MAKVNWKVKTIEMAWQNRAGRRFAVAVQWSVGHSSTIPPRHALSLSLSLSKSKSKSKSLPAPTSRRRTSLLLLRNTWRLDIFSMQGKRVPIALGIIIGGRYRNRNRRTKDGIWTRETLCTVNRSRMSAGPIVSVTLYMYCKSIAYVGWTYRFCDTIVSVTL
jgi:hypothetical protein